MNRSKIQAQTNRLCSFHQHIGAVSTLSVVGRLSSPKCPLHIRRQTRPAKEEDCLRRFVCRVSNNDHVSEQVSLNPTDMHQWMLLHRVWWLSWVHIKNEPGTMCASWDPNGGCRTISAGGTCEITSGPSSTTPSYSTLCQYRMSPCSPAHRGRLQCQGTEYLPLKPQHTATSGWMTQRWGLGQSVKP